MRNAARISLALLTCIYSLAHVLPVSAANSGDLRPAQGKAVAYETYVSYDPKDCKEVADDTVEFSGGATIFVGAGTSPSAYPKAMNLQCAKDYVMVTMSSKTSGGLSTFTIGGGAITNNGKAMCCPVKHRWATPETA